MAGGGEHQTPVAVASSAMFRVAAAVEAAASGGRDFRNAYRRQLLALSGRIRLLVPFTEELREARRVGTEEEEAALAALADMLEKALDLLRLGREGSRIFLVLERDNVMKKRCNCSAGASFV